MELPFAYIEKEESKSALVKVVLCDRCIKKLMYKRTKDKEAARVAAASKTQESNAVRRTGIEDAFLEVTYGSRRRGSREQRETPGTGGNEDRRRDHSRSRSPRDRHRDKHRGHRRSKSP